MTSEGGMGSISLRKELGIFGLMKGLNEPGKGGFIPSTPSFIKSYIFLFCFFIAGALFSQTSGDTIFTSKVDIIIARKPGLYFINLPMNVYVLENTIAFAPVENENYINKFSISFDSIIRVEKVYAGLIFQAKNGTSHRIRIVKHRKALYEVLKKRSKIESGKIKRKHNTERIAKPCNNGCQVKEWIDCFGSTFYSPLLIKGCLRKDDSLLSFIPTQYNTYIKPIDIKIKDINWLQAKGNKKVIIGMKSGVEYKFLCENREQLLVDLRMARSGNEIIRKPDQ